MTRAMGVACFVCVGAAAAQGGVLVFQERAVAAGLTGGHIAPSDFGLQYQAPGAAVGDFDRDGDQDLFVVGGSGGVDQLYINNGDGTFVERAAQWGVNLGGIRHSGASVGDFNNDGWLDLFVTCVKLGTDPNPALNKLFRNNGNGSFTEVAAAAGVQIAPGLHGDSHGSAFGDVDLDGDLDLFVAGYYGGSALYANNGNGTFSPFPNTVFLNDDLTTVRAFAPRFVDMNADGLPDLLLAADFFTSRFYLNNGDGTWTNATAAWGAGLDSNGMGNTVGDFNNDGLTDWYVTSRIASTPGIGSGNMLYMNNGASFTERAVAAGVNFGEWGWGTDAVDFDHDGWLDLVATNGWNGSYFSNDPTHVWRNLGTAAGNFAEVTAAVGVTHRGQGRGLLSFDADLDGDRDFLIVNNNQPITFYRNDLTGNGINAVTLVFDAAGQPGIAPDGFGVRVELDANGITQHRTLDGGSNYLAQSELSVHFGIAAAASAGEVRVFWPSGQTTTLAAVRPGRYTITARFDCPVDWDVNGILDLADISGWVQAFLVQHPQADLTSDGVYDLADLLGFVSLFSTGCP
jgi:hypothetical protein